MTITTILPKEIVQVGDTFLIRYNCPQCGIENFDGFPLVACVGCKKSFVGHPVNCQARFRLVSGSRRKRHLGVKVIRRVYEDFAGACGYCGVPLNNTQYEIDHIIPVSVGGTNTLANLALSCRTCNGKAWAFAFPTFDEKRQFVRRCRGLV